MTIPAKYENGVFRPLEIVQMKEGTVVEVLVPVEQKPAGKTVPTSATASIT
jgi:predicted DNA-binding antitoxin AbrB/MazE fold protein